MGNRLSEVTDAGTNTYVYDVANRLTSVNGTAYTWDANGNLLSDGTNSYTYDHANRLVELTQGSDVYSYAYNGQGDRYQQTLNGVTTTYQLDLAGGLTQVLADGDTTYLYGVNRIAQVSPTQTGYFLPDVLGSVRQIANGNTPAEIVLAQTYTPYGEMLESYGTGISEYAFTGELYDPQTGLVYLRARYYAPNVGKFTALDVWDGDARIPASFNQHLYAYNNPIIHVDPSGKCVDIDGDGKCENTNNREPNTRDYNEKMRPFGITFIPVADPLAIGAQGIPYGTQAAQSKVRNPDYWNACGTTSIAAILAMSNPEITAQIVLENFEEIIRGDVTKDTGTGYEELAKYVNQDISHSWSAIPHTNEMGEGQTGQNRYINQFTFSFSRMLIVGVEIEDSGKIISSGRAGVCNADTIAGKNSAFCNGLIYHWAVVTGKSSEWDRSRSNSSYNWLRVYNPYDNETEYYWWEDFKKSMNIMFGKVTTMKDVEAELRNAGLK